MLPEAERSFALKSFETDMDNNMRAARSAGWGLIIMTLLAGLAFGLIWSKIYYADQASVSLEALSRNPRMLPFFMSVYVLIALLDIAVGLWLYRWAAPVRPRLAWATACSRIVYAMMMLYALKPLVTFLLLPGTDGFSAMQLFEQYWQLSLIVFGLHLCIWGAMMYGMHRKVPRWTWLLLILAGCCYSVHHAALLYWPAYQPYASSIQSLLAMPMMLGELLPAIWLSVHKERA